MVNEAECETNKLFVVSEWRTFLLNAISAGKFHNEKKRKEKFPLIYPCCPPPSLPVWRHDFSRFFVVLSLSFFFFLRSESEFWIITTKTPSSGFSQSRLNKTSSRRRGPVKISNFKNFLMRFPGRAERSEQRNTANSPFTRDNRMAYLPNEALRNGWRTVNYYVAKGFPFDLRFSIWVVHCSHSTLAHIFTIVWIKYSSGF